MKFGNKPLKFAVPEPSDDTSHEGTCRGVLRKQAAETAKARLTENVASAAAAIALAAVVAVVAVTIVAVGAPSLACVRAAASTSAAFPKAAAVRCRTWTSCATA